jgi:DNA-binding NarL/FixJ family response regulator
LAVLYFGADVIFDLFGLDKPEAAGGENQTVENLMTLVLILSALSTGYALYKFHRRHLSLDRQIRVASGAFETVLQEHFDQWSLTASERDVARLAIKGLSIAEMADLRGSKEGTIKAHSAAIYRKSGVTGRLELLSLFIEEIMADPPLDVN